MGLIAGIKKWLGVDEERPQLPFLMSVEERKEYVDKYRTIRILSGMRKAKPYYKKVFSLYAGNEKVAQCEGDDGKEQCLQAWLLLHFTEYFKRAKHEYSGIIFRSKIDERFCDVHKEYHEGCDIMLNVYFDSLNYVLLALGFHLEYDAGSSVDNRIYHIGVILDDDYPSFDDRWELARIRSYEPWLCNGENVINITNSSGKVWQVYRVVKKSNFTPEDFRGSIEKLFQFVPYFEKRVNGTFKFQTRNDTTGKITDLEGYEEYNKTANFSDPLFDFQWKSFHLIVCIELVERVNLVQDFPEENADFFNLLRKLCYDTVHERMCTGYTASCISKGIYLKELRQLWYIVRISSVCF